MDKQEEKTEKQVKAKKERYQIDDELIFGLDYTLNEENEERLEEEEKE